ncbi:MAG: WecB/TagA/CpsF family glycosyltransferase [Patescibacteria group bacterium]|jgi:N-acetylglucosaminyldiphosphoundecaprenol N-acetyl-beta-D-mannosaminyltransferase
MIERKILNIHLHDLSNQELEKLFLSWLGGNEQKIIVTPNPEFLLLARRDKEFADILNRADLSLPDGFGLKLVSHLRHRHTGVDTLEHLAKLPVTMCLLGSAKNAMAAAEIFKQKNPQIKISIVDPNQVASTGEVSETVLTEINKNSPNILAVGLGQGKQERFIVKNLARLPSVRLAIGVGGAFDMISGQLPRAPRFMRQMGLEWLWRLVIEPKRWRRIARAVLIFPIVVIYDKIRGLKSV